MEKLLLICRCCREDSLTASPLYRCQSKRAQSALPGNADKRHRGVNMLLKYEMKEVNRLKDVIEQMGREIAELRGEVNALRAMRGSGSKILRPGD
jgi:hypothetical protein